MCDLEWPWDVLFSAASRDRARHTWSDVDHTTPDHVCHQQQQPWFISHIIIIIIIMCDLEWPCSLPCHVTGSEVDHLTPNHHQPWFNTNNHIIITTCDLEWPWDVLFSAVSRDRVRGRPSSTKPHKPRPPSSSRFSTNIIIVIKGLKRVYDSLQKTHSRAMESHLPCGITCHPTKVNAAHLNQSGRPVFNLPLKGWKAELTLVVGYTRRRFEVWKRFSLCASNVQRLTNTSSLVGIFFVAVEFCWLLSNQQI